MTLRLRTFGAVYLERDGSPLAGAHSQRRRLALLAYLAAANGAVITRARLIALLWPESDEASGRHSLSQLLYSLRHDLGTGAIVIDSETARLDPLVLPGDLNAFEAAVRAGELEKAVELYQGEYLDGFHLDGAPDFDRWMEEQRFRHRAACARALELLADGATRSGDHHRAVEFWRRRVTMEPTDGRATHRLMKSLIAIGDREGALRAARVYETLAREELEVEPDAAVTELVTEVRRAAPVAVQSVSDKPPAAIQEAQALRSPPASQVAPEPYASPGAEPNTAVASPAARHGVPADEQETSRPVRSSRLSRPRLVRPLLMAVAVAVAASALVIVRNVLGSAGNERPGSESPDGTTVVVGDLEGPDAILSLAVREALRAELQNTSGVLLTSDLGIRELKSLMRLPHDSALRSGPLLALAGRAGAQVAVAGSVLPVGSGAQIVIELLDPETGQPIRTFTERPVDGPGLLAAVGDIGRAIGDAVSRTPRDTTRRALPAVMTASLPALKSYALARQLASSGNRRESIAPAERSVTHDSTFALAHYFLGDVLWFIDEQTHAEAHLTRAFELLGDLPLREQLVIRARYEQLVRDRPDSALVYWDLLHDASPGDVLAYEGRSWALRALGRHEEAAAAADTAITLDPGAVFPNAHNAIYSWLGIGDTLRALAMGTRIEGRAPDAPIETRFYAALFRGDTAAAVALGESTVAPMSRYWRRHQASLARGDRGAARLALDSLVSRPVEMAFVPNALLNQGLLELALDDDRARAAGLARQTLEWVRGRDLSPPAAGRLAERIGHLAALAGDQAGVRAMISLVRERDRGRLLPSYVMTLRTLDAALAFSRGQYDEAARRAAEARRGVFFSRSLAAVVQLEADARRAAGERAAADSLEALITTHQIVDGNFEAWAAIRSALALRTQRRRTAATGR
ncbi:MAG: BTAD domain-containing putative transcriptional regulator [Gemmatimonadota bacterium]